MKYLIALNSSGADVILPDGVTSIADEADDQEHKAPEKETWLELGLNTIQ